MIIDALCYIGLGILVLFCLSMLAAAVFVIGMILRDKRDEKDEQKK